MDIPNPQNSIKQRLQKRLFSFSLNGRVTQTNGPQGVTSKVLTMHVEDSWNIQNGLTHLKEKKTEEPTNRFRIKK